MAAFPYRPIRGKRNRRPYVTTTAAPAGNHKVKEDEEKEQSTEAPKDFTVMPPKTMEPDEQAEKEQEPQEEEEEQQQRELSGDPIVNLIATVLPMVASRSDSDSKPMIIEKSSRPEHIPDIASLFAESVQSRKDNVFEGLETHEIRSLSRSSGKSPVLKMEHREDEEEANKDLVDAHTIGPYDTAEHHPDYQSDQAEVDQAKEQDEDSSTILPEAEPAYRYIIKTRSNGKVLEPPSN